MDDFPACRCPKGDCPYHRNLEKDSVTPKERDQLNVILGQIKRKSKIQKEVNRAERNLAKPLGEYKTFWESRLSVLQSQMNQTDKRIEECIKEIGPMRYELIQKKIESAWSDEFRFLEDFNQIRGRWKILDELIGAAKGMSMEACIDQYKKNQDRWYNELDLITEILHIHERGIDVAVECHRGPHKGGALGRWNWKWEELQQHIINHYTKHKMSLPGA